ncbi:hypothetical protein JAAARDRAFT_37253 [Jaapia argillacea MUCL 33604]|uniref:Copper transport protein n=1 Tax=Jaapia argillacea MUCL 33604 TaxID=933084 RepID=A0A067PX19_9AGAM|nr:hypothetical protein JAAARDRAFT_37253 [Jaapia argillacea MUCL 33604]
MNHGDHSGHSMHMAAAPAPARCSMYMLWNTNIVNTCIVFREWHIYSMTGFVVSFFIILALGVLYEWLRVLQTRLDRRIALGLKRERAKGPVRAGSGSGRNSPDEAPEDTGLLTGRRTGKGSDIPVPLAPRALRALAYATTVFLSFFLMLVFMTYNAYLILAVVIGAGIGNYMFNSHMDVDSVLAGGAGAGKTMACH